MAVSTLKYNGVNSLGGGVNNDEVGVPSDFGLAAIYLSIPTGC